MDPRNARALAIKDLLDQEQKKIAMDGIELDVASEEPITLSFKDANIKEVFGMLSRLSGINFIFDEDIRTKSISVLLEKASFVQAMELIMQMNGLDKKVLNSKTIIIYPQNQGESKTVRRPDYSNLLPVTYRCQESRQPVAHHAAAAQDLRP